MVAGHQPWHGRRGSRRSPWRGKGRSRDPDLSG